MKARLITAALAAASLAGLALASAGPAAAAVPHAALPVTASTFITTPDNGHGTPSQWANDSFTEAAQVASAGVVASSNCAPDPGTCYGYVVPFGVSDKGEFRTIIGAGAPNQAPGAYAGRAIVASAVGSLTGTVTYTEFYSVEKPSASNVPHSLNGVSDTGTYPALFFADPSEVHGLTIETYRFAYKVTGPAPAVAQKQSWLDTSDPANNDGNAYGDGQITG